MRSTCRKCYGARVIVKTPCTECEGKGKTVQRKKVVVPVPAGVEDGQTVRMPVGNKEIFITFRVSLILLIIYSSCQLVTSSFWWILNSSVRGRVSEVLDTAES